MAVVIIIVVMLVLIIVAVIIVVIMVIVTTMLMPVTMIVMMSRYPVLVLIAAHRKPGIPARADPGQATRDMLRLPTAVGQGAPRGFSRFQLRKSRDIVIIGITRHPVDMKGKITHPEIEPAGAGHAFRHGLILQGHLAFHVVGHVVKYPAFHNIDNAAAATAAIQ